MNHHETASGQKKYLLKNELPIRHCWWNVSISKVRHAYFELDDSPYGLPIAFVQRIFFEVKQIFSDFPFSDKK